MYYCQLDSSWQAVYIKIDLDGSINWIDLALDRNRWQTLENSMMNFVFHKIHGTS